MKIRYILLYFTFAVAIFSVHAFSQTLHRVNSGTNQTLHAVWFATDNIGSASGDSGTISATSDGGKDWFSYREPLAGNIYTEYFSDSANGAFAGDGGTIYSVLHGNLPVKVSLPETNPIYAMTFPAYDTGVVAGASGLFYMTKDSGKNWKKIMLPANAQNTDFHGTDYFDDDTYWLVGQGGMVLYTEDDGASWQHITVPTTKDLYSIYFPADGSATGWIAGDQTLLLTTDGGDDWTSIPTSGNLRFVAGWDSTDAYTVGLDGAIFYTSDRDHWTSIPSGTAANLYGFDFPDSLFFVGDSGLILAMQPPVPNFVLEGDDTIPGSGLSFGNILDGANSIDNESVINVSSDSITITKISCDSPEFTIDSVLDTETPFRLGTNDALLIEITFMPPIIGSIHTYQTTLRVFSAEAGERDATLTGVGVPLQGSVASQTNIGQTDILLRSGEHCAFISYPSNWIGPIRIEVFNVLGSLVYSSESISVAGVNETPRQLPAGVYIYRLSGSGGSNSGRVIFY